MRRLAVADLILLAAAASALAVGLVAATLLLLFRRRWSSKRPPSQLPISEPPLPMAKKYRRCQRLRQLLLLLLCSRHRTRVEPASANSAGSSPAPDAQGEQAAPGPVEDVATWRERWFGPTSRALYTIDEESSSDGESEDQEPETPFYTPPASPPRPSSGHSPAAGVEATA